MIVGFIPFACSLFTDPAVPCLRASAESGGGLGRSMRVSSVVVVSAIIILSTQYFLWAKKTFGHKIDTMIYLPTCKNEGKHKIQHIGTEYFLKSSLNFCTMVVLRLASLIRREYTIFDHDEANEKR